MSNYQFPKDLSLDIQPYILLTALSWKMRGKKTQEITNIRNIEDSIVLPLSDNGITNNISNNWEEGVGLGAGSFKEAFIKNLVGKISESLGDLGKYVASRRGFAINDYASLAFSGTDFRTFDFEFSFIPKNLDESVTLENIIKVIKKNSLASYQGWKINYPNFWNIDIVFPGDKDIITINNCVLTNFSDQYFKDDSKAINKNGYYLKADISMSFKELDKIDRRDYT